MKKKLLLSAILLLWLLCVCGCIKSLDDEGRTVYSADPCAVKKIEQGAEAGLGILAILSTFWPALIPVVAAGGSVYGTYKRMKPKLTESQTEANLYHTTAHTVVAVIEDIKTKEPALWAKLKPFMEDSQMGKNVTNAILALRGKPPIE